MADQERVLKVFRYFESDEEEREFFQGQVEGLVKSGMLTREQGEFGTGLEHVKDHLRDIAEAELDRQGK